MTDQSVLRDLCADIVSAHVSNNRVAVSDLPNLIQSVYASLASLGEPEVVEEVRQEPAVSIRASVKPDYIVCLEDGKKLKMLKRHLMTHYQMTPEQYRVKWNLPADYPMVAPNYAAARAELAKKIGLGRKPGMTNAKVSAAKAAPKAAPKKAAPKASNKPAPELEKVKDADAQA